MHTNNPTECKEALAAINESETFSRAGRLRHLLDHIVTQSLAGNEDNLLGKNLAQDVFKIDAAATEDISAVRVEIGRLRRRLHEYYEGEGKADPIVIDIPKGAYLATFEARIPAEDSKPNPGANRRVALLAAVLVTLAVGVIAFLRLNATDTADPSEFRPKIAVLPFSNATGEPDDDYLASGFTTELVIAMSQAKNVVVVSRASTPKAASSDVDIQRLGNKLSAQYIVLGTVRKSETELKVTAELAETATGNIVWAKAFVKPLGSSKGFETASDIAAQIAQTVAQPYGVVYSKAISTLKATKLTSYQCILKAYDYERKRGAEYHSEIRDCLEETVAVEPEFATAWILLSAAYLDEHRNGYNRLDNPLERAMVAAQRAVQFAPEDARSHLAVALVHFFRKDMDQFLENSEKALKFDANNADMIANIGFKLVISGTEWDRGIELMDEAMKMSPAHPPLWFFPRALYEYRQHNYEEALEAANRINIPKLYMYHMFRAMILGQLARTADAQQAVDEILKLKPDFAETVRQDMRRRSVPEEMIVQMVDGLQKAGLTVPHE